METSYEGQIFNIFLPFKKSHRKSKGQLLLQMSDNIFLFFSKSRPSLQNRSKMFVKVSFWWEFFQSAVAQLGHISTALHVCVFVCWNV